MSDIGSKTARIMTGVVHAVEALDAIGKVSRELLQNVASGTPPPFDQMTAIVNGLHGVAALVTTVLSGIQGAITPDDVDKALAEFRTLIRDNDAAADSALDQKFR